TSLSLLIACRAKPPVSEGAGSSAPLHSGPHPASAFIVLTDATEWPLGAPEGFVSSGRAIGGGWVGGSTLDTTSSGVAEPARWSTSPGAMPELLPLAVPTAERTDITAANSSGVLVGAHDLPARSPQQRVPVRWSDGGAAVLPLPRNAE